MLSGCTSLIFEVIWFQLLELVFGSTTLAISTILVAYMLGLGIGALFAGRISSYLKNGVRTYGFIEITIGLYALVVPAYSGDSDHSFWFYSITRSSQRDELIVSL